MYDELVKRIRELASIPEHCENVADCDQCSKEEICLSFTNKRIIETATQAADAIEELSAQLLEMGQAGKFLLDAHKINCKMIDPDTIPTDSEWWAKYKALLELLYIPRWIPVTERLPGTGEIVLVYGKRGGIYTAEHNRNARWPGTFWKLNSKSHHCEPTHWMPLPKAPQEE